RPAAVARGRPERPISGSPGEGPLRRLHHDRHCRNCRPPRMDSRVPRHRTLLRTLRTAVAVRYGAGAEGTRESTTSIRDYRADARTGLARGYCFNEWRECPDDV